jgi:Holliday junction resolvase RusA-like endonuclease
MAYQLEFTIPGLPKTTNSKRKFGHWAQAHAEASKWKRSVIPFLTNRKPPTALQKAKVVLVRGSSTCPDYDGLVSSFKHVLDALVEAEVLENDRMDNIGVPEYKWEKAPRELGYIRVRVEEV